MSQQAIEAKNKGNQAFSSGKFEEAIAHFSEAIKLDPNNHVLYSNRSAAYASLHKYEEALADAEKTISLDPKWPKVANFAIYLLNQTFLGLLSKRSSIIWP
jgi:stress-induced-phosphoprotein 1